jgi:hypothetical protein
MADENRTGAGADLDALFAGARQVTPTDDLVARVLADARRVQDDAAPAPAPAPRRSGMFGRPPSWIAALGGWGGLGGVTAAGIVGLAVGFWSPDMVDVLSGGQFWSLSGGGFSPDLAELALESGDV